MDESPNPALHAHLAALFRTSCAGSERHLTKVVCSCGTKGRSAAPAQPRAVGKGGCVVVVVVGGRRHPAARQAHGAAVGERVLIVLAHKTHAQPSPTFLLW